MMENKKGLYNFVEFLNNSNMEDNYTIDFVDSDGVRKRETLMYVKNNYPTATFTKWEFKYGRIVYYLD